MKNIGILFSGGLDSTYLMWKNLKDGNYVKPIYITINNNEVKTKIEKNRVNALIDKFRNEFGYDKVDGLHNVCNFHLTEYYINNLKFVQMPIWIMGLIYSQKVKVDEFQIGYISNDDAVSYIDDFKYIYNSYSSLLCDDVVPIVFPIIKKCKSEIIYELPEDYINLTTSCENPKIINENTQLIEFKMCGNCPACKRILNDDYWNRYALYKELGEVDKINHLYKIYEYGYKVIDNNNNEVVPWPTDGIPIKKRYHQLEIEFPDDNIK